MTGPTRPAREIAITARRRAVHDPANYDDPPPPPPAGHRGHHRHPRSPAATWAARATVAAVAVGTLVVLSLTRPWLAAGLALIMASAVVRMSWQHRHGL